MDQYAGPNPADIVQALLNDPALQFKKVGKYLQRGVCPECQKKELFVSAEQPWQLACNRSNNCGYTESTRTRYPHLFDNYSERFPATPEDPNATARAYLAENRGFNPGLIAGMYQQASVRLSDGEYADTVRFYLFGGTETYWERLIDTGMVKKAGKKAHFGGKRQPDGSMYKNKCWQPRGLQVEKGDWVWITEGIFKSIALMHCEHNGQRVKSVSPLSTNNLPRELIEANRDRDVTWVLALDNDPAGIKFARKYREELRAMGEHVLIALPDGKADWDDELRNGRLDEKYLNESIWRGFAAAAETAQEKAFWLWVKQPRAQVNFAWGASLWKYKVDERDIGDLQDALDPAEPPWLADDDLIKDLQRNFFGATRGERISNCHPQFLYIEQDALTEEQLYFFRFDFTSGNPTSLVSLEGSALESPSAFNKALLNRTAGGTFDGDARDLKRLRDQWFNRRISYVHTIPFVGYYRDAGSYVFPGFGYHKGQGLELNEQGFMECGKHRLKSGLKSLNLIRGESFNPGWIDGYKAAFSDNGMLLMAWWLGSLFAEQVRALQKSWCFLEYTGDQGAGKSTQIEFLWRCCGRDGYEGFDPSKATPAGRARNFMQVSNLPVVLIEGDRNSDDRGARKGGFDMDELKTAFNGRGIRSMGVKKRGAETDEPPFRGSILLSQNATVDGSEALLSRIVHGHCTRAHFSRRTEQHARRLASIPAEDLAGWMGKALSLERSLLDLYQERFAQVEDIYQGLSDGKIQNRLVLNHAQVAAWGWCLP
ncbi:toprim domain-containing protein [Marinobacter nanhaiticus D15-8W]|nr:toprim domain-containing protein [Marinobacter nanhaiticus D15-8W]